jgi:hypothetical protein
MHYQSHLIAQRRNRNRWEFTDYRLNDGFISLGQHATTSQPFVAGIAVALHYLLARFSPALIVTL